MMIGRGRFPNALFDMAGLEVFDSAQIGLAVGFHERHPVGVFITELIMNLGHARNLTQNYHMSTENYSTFQSV